MTLEQIKQIITLLTSKGITFAGGLTEIEILQVETKFNFKFPPDLNRFLQTALPISNGFVNWREGLSSDDAAEKIIERLDWPLEGMLFDVEKNNYWMNEWGEKPATYEEKAIIAKQKFSSFPKLIPIYSHRYIPETPSEEGNPIFSVHQTDIIYYGYDLAAYFANEFHFELPKNFKLIENPKDIYFWGG